MLQPAPLHAAKCCTNCCRCHRRAAVCRAPCDIRRRSGRHHGHGVFVARCICVVHVGFVSVWSRRAARGIDSARRQHGSKDFCTVEQKAGDCSSRGVWLHAHTPLCLWPFWSPLAPAASALPSS
eukprot:355343-Chlamydomonas_euryale.AAC.6